MTQYWAEQDGAGNGTTVDTPGTIFALAPGLGPDDTLWLKSGNYTGPNNMFTVVDKTHGTLGHPITVKAVTDGGVLIDGQSARQPLLLSGVDYWTVEGINFRKSLNTTVARLYNSNYCQVKRCCAWDAPIDWNAVVFSAGAGGGGTAQHNLFEDCCGFGKGRKIFSASQGGDYTTFRRCLGIWMGSTNVGPKMPFTYAYRNYHCIFENCVAMWTGEAMPASYTLMSDGAVWTGAGAGTYTTVEQPYGPFAYDGLSASHDAYTVLKGCISLVRTADNCVPIAGTGLFFAGMLDQITIENCATYSEKAIPGFMLYTDTSETPTGLSANYLTAISPSASLIQAAWLPASGRNILQQAALVSGQDIRDQVNGLGASIRYRYVDGVLTGTGLWPWPMDARIAAALTAGGYTSFTLTNVIAGLGGAVVEPSAPAMVLYEDALRRREGRTTEGHTWYLRVYNVPAEALAAALPAKGDTLPGETLDATNTILGPYVRDIRFGRKLSAKDGSQTLQQVVIEGRKLKTRV